ncbi:MAG: gliding motility-associated C-terminal domain-containing protein [Saprospiraceae bacterium]|nr:gliding motility-associated C-terminal domain-containing protein [Saprospiraceae bacterium]MCF8252369.1 gliding motility-associated C-terminal domain-containing protein [Saprospiraceae bacterium]MCF8282210.1 gliding motility-associated C-terminal domain-containing protein [Bacteroidales bacterium]MCF8311839.1 gliding motility-associated C-terminal domain-containing protein [Saprospiraceae bacterium]MCF8442683.1 gliding motility-associated C-terminal domain-containing protein [Saprospiraceae 
MKTIFPALALIAFGGNAFSQGSNTCISINNGSTQQYVTADNLLNNFSFSKLSVTVWVKPTASNDHGGAIFAFNELSGDFANNVNLVYFKTDHFEYFDRNPSNFNIPTSGYFPPGNWYHVALVIDQNLNGKMYVNGVERLTFQAQEVPVAGDRFSIGQEWDAFDISGLFQGEVDELRVWNTALSEQQIREEMCKSIDPNTLGLVAYYDFDDTGSGNVLSDISPNGNDGTMVVFNANEFVVSGAPIGDESVFVYPNTWSNQAFQLTAGVGKYLKVSDVANSPEGAHIYYVNSTPNTTQGIDFQVVNDYFGVFCSNLDAEYSIEYGYSGYGFNCFECDKTPEIFARNDNAKPVWNGIQAQVQVDNCTATKSGESGNGLSSREEYIIGKSTGAGNISLLPDSVKACANANKILDVSNLGGEAFLWNDGSDSSIFATTGNGIFWVEVTFSGGCKNRDSVIVVDLPVPSAFSLGADVLACQGDSIVINAPQQTGVAFEWSDGSAGNSMLVLEQSNVVLNLTNQCGTATDEVVVSFEDCYQVFVPNSFSPNYDGINDFFNILVKDNRALFIERMVVFDRWGEKVFDKANFMSNETNVGWNGEFKGKPAPSDIFVYLIEMVKPEGKYEKLTGDLTLLR